MSDQTVIIPAQSVAPLIRVLGISHSVTFSAFEPKFDILAERQLEAHMLTTDQFPEDFAFQLPDAESAIRSQIATLNTE